MKLENKKIALVHDYFYTRGGAERVFEGLKEIFPDSPVYTSYYLEDKMPEFYKNWQIHESILGKIPILKKTFLRRYFTLFNYLALRLLKIKDADLVISSSSGPAKGIRFSKGAIHVSYIHTPHWEAWGLKKTRKVFHILFRHLLKRLEFNSSWKPTFLLCNSKTTQERIRHFYLRDAKIIYPPVDVEEIIAHLKQIKIKKEEYFVMCSRLDPYKGISKVAEIISNSNLKLKVIGMPGADLENLQKHISNNIEYLGAVDDKTKWEIISAAKALIFWNVEDFGIVMAEALACGTPVIAYGEGGSVEIVKDGKTGTLFYEQNSESLINAIRKISKMKFKPVELQDSALRFSKLKFNNEILKFIEEL